MGYSASLLKHNTRTMHSNCPTGSLSWFSYQRDIESGTNSYKPSKYPIMDSVAKVVTPIFKRLADEAFLEGYEDALNQNANESFNKALWSFCPEE